MPLTPEGLDISQENAFSQDEIIEKAKGRLSKTGVCNGIVMQYAIAQLSSDRYYSIHNLKHDIKDKFESFLHSTEDYQRNLQTHFVKDASEIFIDGESIDSENFIENLPYNFQNNQIIGLAFEDSTGAHITLIRIIRDKSNKIFGYRIFDPNFGEINCSNLGKAQANREKFNQQLKALYRIYNTEPSTTVMISDLEKLVKTAGLSREKPSLKDKTANPERNETVKVRPILSEYSYEQKNTLLQYYLDQYELYKTTDRDSKILVPIKEDIINLLENGANPNLLPAPLNQQFKSSIFHGEKLANIIKKIILSNDLEALNNVIKFTKKEALQTLSIQNMSVPLYAYNRSDNINFCLELLKGGAEFTQNEIRENNKPRILRKLARDVNATLSNGTPILAELIKFNLNQDLNYLLQNPGVNVNLIDPNANGDSLLHLAVKHNNINIVRKLIQKNANIHLLNGEGKTALHYAEHNPEIKEMLIKAAIPKYSIFMTQARSTEQENISSLNISTNSTTPITPIKRKKLVQSTLSAQTTKGLEEITNKLSRSLKQSSKSGSSLSGIKRKHSELNQNH